MEGPINITGPTPVTNKAFMNSLRKSVNPLFHFNQPRWMLELGALLMRTETELLLKSRYVLPERLMKSGFEFRHASLLDLCKKKYSQNRSTEINQLSARGI